MQKNDPISLSHHGKLEVISKVALGPDTLAHIYTPGVADVVLDIIKDNRRVYDLTWKANTVAIVSDGTAILGLGNHGPLAALPVMEAKAVLFKELAGINAVPIVLGTKDPDQIVQIVQAIAPGFGGINLEDIAAPHCFVIKEKLKKTLDIPVFHDDQYGTAIVVLAGLINAAKVTKLELPSAKVVISGAGAAGIATAKLMVKYGIRNIILFDSQGPLYDHRPDLNYAKQRIAQKTNPEHFSGALRDALSGADVFIGLSAPNLINQFDVERMNQPSIVFALANPVPEIMPEEAAKGGAAVIATGRSDYPNQINNALVFPGIFKGALETRTPIITDEHKLSAAQALAAVVPDPTREHIMPSVLDKKAVQAVAGVFRKDTLVAPFSKS